VSLHYNRWFPEWLLRLREQSGVGYNPWRNQDLTSSSGRSLLTWVKMTERSIKFSNCLTLPGQ
jgi:hypothetical protein